MNSLKSVRIKKIILLLFSSLVVLNSNALAYEKEPVYIAHRGFSQEVYENTIPSIIEARDHLFDGVEIDVIETKDGVLVLSHSDKIILNKSNGEIVFYILKENYADISQFILQEDTNYGEIHFARLDEVLEILTSYNMSVVLHCKIHTLAFFKSVAKTVVQSPMKGKCIYNIDSSNSEWVNSILEIDPSALFQVSYSELQEAGGIDSSRFMVTIEMGTVDDDEILRTSKEYVIYLWNVSEGDFNHAMLLKPDYIEFSDEVDLTDIIIETVSVV